MGMALRSKAKDHRQDAKKASPAGKAFLGALVIKTLGS
jgi:hypothetical protein